MRACGSPSTRQTHSHSSLELMQCTPSPSSSPVQDEGDDDEGSDKIGSLFQKAKAIGAQQGTADDLPTTGAFAGHGRTLAGSSAQVRMGALLCGGICLL